MGCPPAHESGGDGQGHLRRIGAVFGRIGSGLNNAGKTQENALAGLLGVTGEKRTLAATYGVDPYTDFPPLKAKLDRLSEAAALGGLTVSGALLIVPGAAGIIVSNLSTAYRQQRHRARRPGAQLHLSERQKP